MFVDYTVEVGMPEQRVADLLISHGAEMEGMGAAAYRRGEELRSRVGPGGPLAKEVVIAMGKPSMSRQGVVLPVRWRATGAEALFPNLEGELVIERVAGEASVLHLRATYQPPLGSVGSLMDRLLLARLARATVGDWVERIAEWLTSMDGTSSEREDHLDNGAGAHD